MAAAVAAAKERHERLLALAQWLETQDGAEAAADALELADFGELQGWGFRAKRDLVAGEPLVTVPVKLAWSAVAAAVSPTLGPVLRQCSGLRDDDKVALHLMHERATGDGERAAHVRSLPASYDATLLWSASELEELQGSNLAALTERLQAQVLADWEELHRAVVSQHPQLFPRCTLADYQWALCTLWSRAMDFQAASLRCIVPWADLFNSEAGAAVCHAYDAARRCVRVSAARAYASGEQVCISYGSPSAADCLRLYGFVLPPAGGGGAAVELFAEMSPEADGFKAKRRLLDALGVAEGAPHVLTAAEPLPPRLLAAVRVHRLSSAEAAVQAAMGAASPVLQLQRVSAGNELLALSALAAGLQAMLCGYATTLEEDEEALASAAAAALPPRKRAALELRTREKRVLCAALARLTEALHKEDPALQPPQPPLPVEQAAEPPAAEAMAGGGAGEPPAAKAAAALSEYFSGLLSEQDGGGGQAGGMDGID